jgi:aflatoxin B1 aldehyde reductase
VESKGDITIQDISTLRIVYGTMIFGRQTQEREAHEMIWFFLESGGSELDTAYVYSDGKAEEIVGRILKGMNRKQYIIATKAQPRAYGNLSPESIKKQLETSLSRLGLENVDLFYLHQPDPSTPIEITLAAMNKLHQEGKFFELGLSNYPAWEVAHIWHLCNKEKWLVPTVYQGMYNAITRGVEQELFPCLRALGLRFYAYNPLAGGFLTGKYRDSNAQPTSWRFKDNLYRSRYWKEAYFEALRVIMTMCDKEGISMTSAALRWMMHHSMLDSASGDGLIIGASQLSQLKENLKRCREAALPDQIVVAFNDAWEIVKPVCPKYFRP